MSKEEKIVFCTGGGCTAKLGAGVLSRILEKLPASEAGGRKAVGSRRFYAVINQVDTDERTALARQTAELLKKQYGVPCVLTHFEEGERA